MQLFPRPQRISITGESPGGESVDGEPLGDETATGTPARTEPTVTVNASIVPQGYELSIAAGSIEIRHADEAGLRYAKDTLGQLRNQYPDRLPDLAISDWPDTADRAYMLDISRNRVPTMETLEWLVTALAACRFNQLQLYTEHTFAFQEHETVWQDASPITAEEMGELDQLCADHGIELVPCLNVFGHMGPWLRHEEYRDRAECPDGFDFPGLGSGLRPLTLAPTQDNADFALELVRELTGTVTSKKVNICCDEAFELGLGYSKELVADRGKAEVFVDHLLRIMNPLIADGYEVMFWGDMFRVNPEPIARLPQEHATAIAWQYDPPSEPGTGFGSLTSAPGLADMFGFPDDMYLGFESQTRQLSEAGYPFWVSPGTGSWNSLIGRWPSAKANLLDAVDVGLKAGATGLILSDWGDTGHMQPLSVSVLPIVYGGAVSWCAESNRDIPVAGEASRIVFGDETGLLAGVLETLGGLGEQCGRTGANGSALFYDLILKPPFPVTGSITREELDGLLKQLDLAAAYVVSATPTCNQADAIKLELLAAIRLARHGAFRVGRASGLADRDDAALSRDLDKAIRLQKRAWDGRSRSGGQELSLRRLEATLRSYG